MTTLIALTSSFHTSKMHCCFILEREALALSPFKSKLHQSTFDHEYCLMINKIRFIIESYELEKLSILFDIFYKVV